MRGARLQWPVLCMLSWLTLLLAAGLVRAGTTKDSTATSSTAADSAEETPQQLQNRVARLIQLLGSEQYLARQAAQDELAKIGPEAIDALIHAENSPDMEIAFRAQYLVRSIHIDWVRDTDSPPAQKALQ